jgi:hypothetical protein
VSLRAFMTGDQDAIRRRWARARPMRWEPGDRCALMVPLMALLVRPGAGDDARHGAVAAMKASFFACFATSSVPGLRLVMIVAAIVAVIPFGLGMLVWVRWRSPRPTSRTADLHRGRRRRR